MKGGLIDQSSTIYHNYMARGLLCSIVCNPCQGVDGLYSSGGSPWSGILQLPRRLPLNCLALLPCHNHLCCSPGSGSSFDWHSVAASCDHLCCLSGPGSCCSSEVSRPAAAITSVRRQRLLHLHVHVFSPDLAIARLGIVTFCDMQVQPGCCIPGFRHALTHEQTHSRLEYMFNKYAPYHVIIRS